MGNTKHIAYIVFIIIHNLVHTHNEYAARAAYCVNGWLVNGLSNGVIYNTTNGESDFSYKNINNKTTH